MPRRIQRSRAKGWRKPPDAIYIGRPGPWGNPFIVGRDGTALQCVKAYTYLLAGYLNLTCKVEIDEQRRALRYAAKHLPDLKGRDLLCWCRLDKPCHGDILLKLAVGNRITVGPLIRVTP